MTGVDYDRIAKHRAEYAIIPSNLETNATQFCRMGVVKRRRRRKSPRST